MDVLQNQMWWYTVDPEAEEPVMLINKHIGFDETDGFGIMGDLFQRELLSLDVLCQQTNRKRIQVWINSPGGIVEDGMSIYSAILKSVTKCDTYCDGMAASISGVIFQAGRSRIMADYSYLMYHNPYGSDDDKGMAAVTDMIVKMITGRTGKTEAEIIKVMNKTSWIPADEALQTGFCDVIQASGELNQKRKVSNKDEMKAFFHDRQKALNKFFNIKNTLPMANEFSTICNKLKLNPMASAEAIADEIGNIMAKKSDAEKKCEDLEKKLADHKAEMDKAKKELDDMKKEHDDMKKQHDDLKKKMDDEADAKAKAKSDEEAKAKAETEEKAKNYINLAATQGRIPSDKATIDLWTKKAIEDFDGIKNMLEKQPANKKAADAKIPVPTPGAGTGKITNLEEAGKVKSVAMMMALKEKALDDNFRNRAR